MLTAVGASFSGDRVAMELADLVESFPGCIYGSVGILILIGADNNVADAVEDGGIAQKGGVDTGHGVFGHFEGGGGGASAGLKLPVGEVD